MLEGDHVGMIGKNLKKYRKAKGISLTELALRANVSKSYLNSLERDIKSNPSINVIKRIADVLDTEINSILGVSKGEVDSSINVKEEWKIFIEEAKKAGIQKDDLSEFKEIIAFLKWKNQKQSKQS